MGVLYTDHEKFDPCHYTDALIAVVTRKWRHQKIQSGMIMKSRNP